MATPPEVRRSPAHSARDVQAGHLQGAPPWMFNLLLVFLVFDICRLQTVVPALGVVRVQLLLTLVLALSILSRLSGSLVRDQAVLWPGFFAALCGLSLFFAPNTYHAFNSMQAIVLYLMSVILPLVLCVTSRQRLLTVLKVWVWSHVFLAAWSLTHGGKGPGGYVRDENDLSLVLNVTIPIAFALSTVLRTEKDSRSRWIYLAATLLLIAGTVATQSRGGFLGLVAAAGGIWWMGRNRVKHFFLAIVLSALAGGAIVAMLPEGYLDEMQSITDTEDGTRKHRLYFWELGIFMYQHNPIFGVGAGNYPWTVHVYELMLPEEQRYGMLSGGVQHIHCILLCYLSLVVRGRLFGVWLCTPQFEGLGARRGPGQ